MSPGYYGEPASTAEAFKFGFYFTKDIGRANPSIFTSKSTKLRIESSTSGTSEVLFLLHSVFYLFYSASSCCFYFLLLFSHLFIGFVFKSYSRRI